jgi:hypothetical protein
MPVPIRRIPHFVRLLLGFVVAVVAVFFVVDGAHTNEGPVAQAAPTNELQLRYLHTGLETVRPNGEFRTTATCLNDEIINSGGFVLRSYNQLLPPVVLESRPETFGGVLDSWAVTIFNPDPKAAVTFQVYATCWATPEVGEYSG